MYLYIFIFVVWNMLMASVLTIPIYKIVCSLSYIDYNSTLLWINKEYAYSLIPNVYMFNGSLLNKVQHAWFAIHVMPDLYGYDSMLLTDYVEFIAYLPISEIHKSHNFVHFDMYSQYIDIKLISRVSNLTLLEFVSLQYHIIASTGESTLVFFRMYNPTSFDVLGISMYYVFPSVYAMYLSKIQCFCFDLLQIYSGETVELPVLFYISSLVDSTFSTNNIIISYVYFVN